MVFDFTAIKEEEEEAFREASRGAGMSNPFAALLIVKVALEMVAPLLLAARLAALRKGIWQPLFGVYGMIAGHERRGREERGYIRRV